MFITLSATDAPMKYEYVLVNANAYSYLTVCVSAATTNAA